MATQSPYQPAPTPVQPQGGGGMAVTSLVLGIVGLALAWIPLLNYIGLVLAVIGLVLGAVGLAGALKGRRTGKGMAITGIVLSILAAASVFVSGYIYTQAFNDAVDEVNDEIDDTVNRMDGSATEDILENELTVEFGEFTVEEDEYGFQEPSVEVTFTNVSEETESYTVTVEAADADGNRIAEDYFYASDLQAGQSVTEKLFTLVLEDDFDAMDSAELRVVEVTA
ncbi:FxLYD domain-containing protein [Salininema proteolyticum]|uniref:FxLYD domain-containing protein n=1 Tax=Salininema proteolyticum TaxID=1607685 RepID=A0ABV8TZB8_9ACTN